MADVQPETETYSLGYSSKPEHKQRSISFQSLTRCEPSRLEGRVDLRSLFSGQLFSFLADGREGREEPGESESGTITSQTGSAANGVSVRAQQGETRSCFFFHWSNSELSNRCDYSFHTSRAREDLERGWPEQRSAMKQLLRQSHRHAVRTSRQKKRTNRTVT
jgi:hypothetical protein